MKKTIYFAILTIITVFCIIIGSIMHLGLFRLGLNPFRAGNGWRAEITEEIADEITDTVISEAAKETADAISDAMKDISEINVNCDVMDFNIVPGKKFDLSYHFSDDDLRPVISTQNGVLAITQASSGWKHRFGHHADSHHLLGSATASDFTITVPEGTAFKNISIQLDIGNADLQDISAESCDITINAGDIELKDFTCTSLEISGDAGNAACENCNIKDAVIDLDIGNVTYQAKNALSDYHITLVTDLGEVQAFGESHGRSFSQSGQSGSLKITADVGSITVK